MKTNNESQFHLFQGGNTDPDYLSLLRRIEALESKVETLENALIKQATVQTVKDDPVLDKIVEFMKTNRLKMNGKMIAGNIDEDARQIYHRLEKLHRMGLITCHKSGKENPLWSWNAD